MVDIAVQPGCTSLVYFFESSLVVDVVGMVYELCDKRVEVKRAQAQIHHRGRGGGGGHFPSASGRQGKGKGGRNSDQSGHRGKGDHGGKGKGTTMCLLACPLSSFLTPSSL